MKYISILIALALCSSVVLATSLTTFSPSDNGTIYATFSGYQSNSSAFFTIPQGANITSATFQITGNNNGEQVNSLKNDIGTGTNAGYNYMKHALLAQNGTMLIVYYYNAGTNMRLKQINTKGGSSDVVIPTGGGASYGQFHSIAQAPNGTVLISYYDTTNANLRLASLDSDGSWHDQVIPTVHVSSVGQYSSIVVDSNGAVSIAYDDVPAAQQLRVIQWNASGQWYDWNITTNSTGFEQMYGMRNMILLRNGNLAISYYDATDKDLRLVQFNYSNGVSYDQETGCEAVAACGAEHGYQSGLVQANNDSIIIHYKDVTSTDAAYAILEPTNTWYFRKIFTSSYSYYGEAPIVAPNGSIDLVYMPYNSCGTLTRCLRWATLDGGTLTDRQRTVGENYEGYYADSAYLWNGSLLTVYGDYNSGTDYTRIDYIHTNYPSNVTVRVGAVAAYTGNVTALGVTQNIPDFAASLTTWLNSNSNPTIELNSSSKGTIIADNVNIVYQQRAMSIGTPSNGTVYKMGTNTTTFYVESYIGTTLTDLDVNPTVGETQLPVWCGAVSKVSTGNYTFDCTVPEHTAYGTSDIVTVTGVLNGYTMQDSTTLVAVAKTMTKNPMNSTWYLMPTYSFNVTLTTKHNDVLRDLDAGPTIVESAGSWCGTAVKNAGTGSYNVSCTIPAGTNYGTTDVLTYYGSMAGDTISNTTTLEVVHRNITIAQPANATVYRAIGVPTKVVVEAKNDGVLRDLDEVPYLSETQAPAWCGALVKTDTGNYSTTCTIPGGTGAGTQNLITISGNMSGYPLTDTLTIESTGSKTLSIVQPSANATVYNQSGQTIFIVAEATDGGVLTDLDALPTVTESGILDWCGEAGKISGMNGNYTVNCTIPIGTPFGTTNNIQLSGAMGGTVVSNSITIDVVEKTMTLSVPANMTVYNTSGTNIPIMILTKQDGVLRDLDAAATPNILESEAPPWCTVPMAHPGVGTYVGICSVPGGATNGTINTVDFSGVMATEIISTTLNIDVVTKALTVTTPSNATVYRAPSAAVSVVIQTSANGILKDLDGAAVPVIGESVGPWCGAVSKTATGTYTATCTIPGGTVAGTQDILSISGVLMDDTVADTQIIEVATKEMMIINPTNATAYNASGTAITVAVQTRMNLNRRDLDLGAVPVVTETQAPAWCGAFSKISDGNYSATCTIPASATSGTQNVLTITGTLYGDLLINNSLTIESTGGTVTPSTTTINIEPQIWGPSRRDVTTETITAHNVDGGEVQTFKFNNPSVAAFSAVVIKPKGATSPKIVVKADASKADTSTLRGTVYRASDLTVEGISGEATLYFDVEKGWILTNNGDKTQIRLAHKTSDGWEILPTSLAGETDVAYNYYSKATSFSPFAIVLMNADQEQATILDLRNKTLSKGAAEWVVWILSACIFLVLVAIFILFATRLRYYSVGDQKLF